MKTKEKVMPSEYNEYIENLINISRLTTKDNSILFNFEIQDDNCYSQVTLVEHTGTRIELKDAEFLCTDEFYNDFLKKLVVDFYDSNKVVLADTIDMNNDKLMTYRMITEYNDLFSINGLPLDYSEELLSLVATEKEVVEAKELIKMPNDKGLGSMWSFVIIIGVIALLLVYVLCF